MGVEPTAACSAQPATSFEDWGAHRDTTTPATSLTHSCQFCISGQNWPTSAILSPYPSTLYPLIWLPPTNTIILNYSPASRGIPLNVISRFICPLRGVKANMPEVKRVLEISFVLFCLVGLLSVTLVLAYSPKTDTLENFYPYPYPAPHLYLPLIQKEWGEPLPTPTNTPTPTLTPTPTVTPTPTATPTLSPYP
ncbi:MAG TPA: hypothetical protein EYP90_02425 [Chromatiaceae bacterium]|nr:hypothetical protein [Chromatiaceae bacterium]